MLRLILPFFVSFFSVQCFAQSSRSAVVSATVYSAVGVEDIPGTTSSSQLSAFTIASSTGIKITRNTHTSVELTSFKILGADDNLFSLSLPAPIIRLVNQTDRSNLLLNELQVKRSDSQQAGLFVLQGKANLQTPLSVGSYSGEAPLAVIIHFN